MLRTFPIMLLPVSDYRELGGRLISQAKTITTETVGDIYPQHYYTYHQDVDSLSRILALIKAPPGFLLFSGQDENGLYLQVGIIGQENYVRAGKPDISKLVYGRKWRIDADTPTTEIVQTTLLAVQKVREHEVRELLSWTDPDNGVRTTPFSCHQDINLLTLHFAHSKPQAAAHRNEAELTPIISQLRFAGRELKLLQLLPLGSGRLLLELALSAATSPDDSFADLGHHPISLVLQGADISFFLHELMEQIILLSNRYCQEHFSFCGVNRFSREHDPRVIANISRRSRPYKKHLADSSFSEVFERVNAEVDKNRAPYLGSHFLGHINKSILAKHPSLGGFMPKDYLSEL